MTPGQIEYAVKKGLELARQKHGSHITFCGWAESWEDCLEWHHSMPNRALFYYNIGVDTRAITILF